MSLVVSSSSIHNERYDFENILAKKDKEALLDLFRNYRITDSQIEAQIQKLGKTQFLEGSSYYFLITTLCERYPVLKDYLGRHMVFSGNGWSISVDHTYGITYEGIQEIVRIRKIDAVVAKSLQELKELFSNMEEHQTKACITDLGLLCQSEHNYHAISLFLERIGKTMRVIVLDSEGNSHRCLSAYKDIQKRLPDTLCLQLFSSEVVRQPERSITCYAFAIADCETFEKCPSIISDILSENSLQVHSGVLGQSEKLKKLPGVLMEISNMQLAREKALMYQSLLVRNRKSPFERTVEKFLGE